MDKEEEIRDHYRKLWNDQKLHMWEVEREVKVMQSRLDAVGTELNVRNVIITVLVDEIETLAKEIVRAKNEPERHKGQ